MTSSTSKLISETKPGAPRKTIVMTGATAGIGLAAAAQIRQVPGIRLLIGARGQSVPEVESLPLDLARLASVRSFAAAVEERLGETSIDALVLNAGVSFSNADQRTEDGFETTFAVNHLAHYLLLRLLMPRLAFGAVVVITTSNTHDPKTVPFGSPEHADAKKLAKGQVRLDPNAKPSSIRAYSTSKLCNVLTARALAASTIAKERGLHVIAFNPGGTPGTQLARHHSRGVKFLVAALTPILGPILGLNTVEGGGELLANLALARTAPPTGRLYASQVRRKLTWPDPSELARDDSVMAKLWLDSASLVGLPEPNSEIDNSTSIVTEKKECKQPPGVFIPVIDRNRCEGKTPCVTVCPYDVFTIDTLPKEQRGDLSILGKVKGFAHGWKQAFAINADACRACGLCIAACPEKAIKLVRVP